MDFASATPGDASDGAPLDVLIIGAGLSGVGCGCRLSAKAPSKTFAIIEARERSGGTWDLFRYPGIRSDSDLYTFGYDFRPWKSSKLIADGRSIVDYIRDTAAEYGVDQKIRYGRKVVAADWDSNTALWTVTAKCSDTGAEEKLQARWLFGATGYYDYDQGYRPHFEGEEDFTGAILHPQHWPENFDYSGKRVAIIGSGATAVTLLPAMARDAAHVTQIQRTPTYVMPIPSRDKTGALIKRLLPEGLAFRINRQRQIWRQRYFWLFCQRYPATARKLIRKVNVSFLPKGYPVDEHFNPPYTPWDQRVCFVPDADMFRALKSGKASIVTGGIERITPTGVRMQSGEEIPADVIVAATGLNIKLFGGVKASVDGVQIVPSDKLVFKGTMLDGVPNFCFAVGYTNSSWTLKVGLLCEYFCRLLAYMDKKGYASVEALRPEGEIETRPLLDFGAGYVKRALNKLPRQGDSHPWEMTFSYTSDAKLLRRGRIAEPALRFAPPPKTDARAVREAAE